ESADAQDNSGDYDHENDLTLQADHSIIVNAAITNLGTGSLVLRAGQTIDIGASISLGGGSLLGEAGRNIVVTADITTGGGDITLQAVGAVLVEDLTTTGNISVTSSTADIARTSAGSLLSGSTITLTAATGIGTGPNH